jgi:hypothetical protein
MRSNVSYDSRFLLTGRPQRTQIGSAPILSYAVKLDEDDEKVWMVDPDDLEPIGP